jgi:molybdopterin synthase sulfur carrier subunit
VPREVREVRGIPLWLLREYLVEGGGRAESDEVVTGPGWRVRLEQIEDFRIGSLTVGQLRLELEGDEAGLARLKAVLEPKLLRAGG